MPPYSYENKDYMKIRIIQTKQPCNKTQSSCDENIDDNNIQCYLCDEEFIDIEDCA